ncbi:hypothetical protein D1614_20000 [Maribellus luteus]|uniref:Carboxypeptidase-like regulatory domain-containing protein n=2 Tax=Maribellus luteus TaxID=2305463 RepID=A0A399SQE5_9BACT|nr:hypothetical protein D1614_20000 [Maribellus luteus]
MAVNSFIPDLWRNKARHMKQLLLASFILSGLCSMAQDERMLIQGKIVDAKGAPVPDVYIVNLLSHEKDISLKNGVFTLNILPTDSLLLSHISYFRKIVSATQLLRNPVITLESESIHVEEITVSPDEKSAAEIVSQNLNVKEWDIRPLPGDGFSESERAKQTMAENNSVLRSEASSVSLLKFSVGGMLEKWKKKRKKRKNYR